jgi:hypothetical protein
MTADVIRLRNRNAQRRFRARTKKLQAASWCDYDAKVLDMLIRRKYLNENEAEDKSQIRRALTLFLADIAHADA